MLIPRFDKPLRCRSRMPSVKIERTRQIQRMLNQKMDVVDIAEEFGITKNAVYKIIQSYGLRFPK